MSQHTNPSQVYDQQSNSVAASAASPTARGRKFLGSLRFSEILTGKPKALEVVGLLVAYGALGAYFVRSSSSTAALKWMIIYSPTDFVNASFSKILAFFQNLMIPIPPMIALAEIISVKLVGSAVLVTRYGYRAALVVCFAAAIAIASTSRIRMLASVLLSILFLYVTVLVHPANPQDYDIFFPMFFVVYLVLLQAASTGRGAGGRVPWLVPAAAGFFLSMTELSRPFVIYLMPLLLVGAYFAFSPDRRKTGFIAFMVPVLLISGGWHGYLLLAHHQLIFSNQVGFNIHRAWPQIPMGPLVPETNAAPLAAGRWPNLNTAEHAENSRLMIQAALGYWLRHPLDSLLYVFSRMDALLAAGTGFRGYNPYSPWFGLYGLLVRITSSFVIAGTGVLLVEACRRIQLIPGILAEVDNIILLFTVACIVFLATGEIREEPRLLLSLLPFFATLPWYRAPSHERTEAAQAPSLAGA